MLLTFLIVFNKQDFLGHSPGRTSKEEEDMRKLKDSYKQEAARAQEKYLAQIESLISKNELEKERIAQAIDKRRMELEQEINEERRLRTLAEKKNIELEDALQRSQAKVAELEKLWKRLSSDYENLNQQNNELFNQMQKFSIERDQNLKEQQKRYELKIKALNDEIARYGEQMNQIVRENEKKLQQTKNEWAEECQRLSEQVKRLNGTLEKMRVDHELEIQQVRKQVQQQENDKIQRVFREIGEKLRGDRRDVSPLKEEQGSQLSGVRSSKTLGSPGKVKQESRASFGGAEREIEKMLVENRKLKDQLAEALKINEQLEQEADWKEKALAKLEEEVSVLHSHGSRTRGTYQLEMEKLASAAKEDKRAWQQTEKSLKSKIEQLELSIGQSREEHAKVKREYEQLKELLQGNVNKVIAQTFLEHESAVEGK